MMRLYVARREKNANVGLRYEGVTVERNVRYGERKYQTFSLYRKSERTLPIVINFHGGGVVGRTKNSRRAFCVSIARELDVAVMNVEYRGETSLGARACLEEVEKLFPYLKESAKSLALDVDKVFLVGDGIGAYLASYLATVAPKYDVRVIGVCGFSGLYDTITHAKENQYYPTQYHLLKKFFRVDLKRATEWMITTELNEMSVTKRVNEDYPPCFLVHSVHDEFLPEQGDHFAEVLRSFGVYCFRFKVVYERLYYNFHLDRKSAISGRVMKFLFTFINEALNGGIYRNEHREI